MRYWRLPTLLLVVALCVTEAIATERILNFRSDIQINPDSSLQVHETIKVESEGQLIRHGIYRDFPTIYQGRFGEHYIVGFKVLDAQRDGSPEEHSEESRSNGVRIKLGSASSLLSPGEYTYELTYRVTREVGFFKDHDELYWNVTGNGWGFEIEHASAIVTLPQPVPEDKLKVAAYTGLQGSREQNFLASRVSDREIQFVTTTTLEPLEGLTIVVEFPKGIVTEPSLTEQIAGMLTENPTFIAVVIGTVIVFVYYLLAWMRVGRDPRRGTLVVRYEPPAGMSPAAISFLRHMGYDDRVLVSAVVNLAVKKYLTIQQEASVYRLQKLKSEDSHLAPEEINLMRNLFSSSDTITVNALERTTFMVAKATMTADLNRSENQKLFQKHWSAIWPGVLMSLLTVGLMVLTVRGATKLPVGFMSLWLSFWSVGVVGLLEAAIKSIRTRAKGTVALCFVALIFTAVEIGVFAAFVGAIGLLPVIALIALLIVNFTFIYLMRSFTPEGRRLMDEIEGFEQFMTSVDSDRLRREGPEKTPALFEAVLPFALALGVEQEWASQFEGVLAQAAMAGARGGYSPTWYSGNDFSGFNANSFASSFGGDFSSAISSASSPPSSSSGGGGGGSSGGGGGGGGGGGW